MKGETGNPASFLYSNGKPTVASWQGSVGDSRCRKFSAAVCR